MAVDESLSIEVRATLQRWQDQGLGSSMVVAVSGGSDSVGLLRVLHELAPVFGLRLSVAHLNHGTRAEASVADAQFVAALADSLGWPFDLGQWTPTRSGHFEADAREARLAWLLEIANTRKANAVALGHTIDDQAETILHRILRGTGPRGLIGIPTRRCLGRNVELVRPLLTVSRAKVRAYLSENGQPWCEDATNADLSRTRSRLRHDLLPKLMTEYNPQVVEALAQLGQLSKGWDQILRRQVARMEQAATIQRNSETILFHRSKLARYPLPLRSEILRRAWRLARWPEREMNAERWHRLAKLAKRNRGLESIGHGVMAEVTSNHFILRKTPIGPLPSRPGPIILPIPGTVKWGYAHIHTTLDALAICQERIDLDQIVPPLQVRSAASNDRFDPLGMGGRSTSLNDFFRGRRIPKPDRGKVPIVVDQLGTIWVVGHRIADRVRITQATQKILGLRWESVA